MKTIEQPTVTIEPVRQGDEELIQEIFDAMSPEARFHRFLQAMPVLSSGMRRLLADVDGVKHRAWVAMADDRPVGIVRIIVDQDGDMELSVAVIDAMHRRGIGRRLVATALQAAAESGHPTVTVLVHPVNRASVAMFRSLGTSFRNDYGLLVGRVPTSRMAAAA